MIKTTSDIIRENKEVAESVLNNEYKAELKEASEKKWIAIVGSQSSEYKDQELKLLNKLVECIKEENTKQIKKWGIQTHSIFEWLTYTTEELGELAQAISEYEYRDGHKADVVKEAIQTATLCLKIAEMVLSKKPRGEKNDKV